MRLGPQYPVEPGRGRIPLYLAHEFDPEVPLEETVVAFEDLVKSGTVGAYGVSNFSAHQLEQAADAGSPACVQNSFSLLERSDEDELLPLCEERGVAYLAFGPLAGRIWRVGAGNGGLATSGSGDAGSKP